MTTPSPRLLPTSLPAFASADCLRERRPPSRVGAASRALFAFASVSGFASASVAVEAGVGEHRQALLEVAVHDALSWGWSAPSLGKDVGKDACEPRYPHLQLPRRNLSPPNCRRSVEEQDDEDAVMLWRTKQWRRPSLPAAARAHTSSPHLLLPPPLLAAAQACLTSSPLPPAVAQARLASSPLPSCSRSSSPRLLSPSSASSSPPSCSRSSSSELTLPPPPSLPEAARAHLTSSPLPLPPPPLPSCSRSSSPPPLPPPPLLPSCNRSRLRELASARPPAVELSPATSSAACCRL